MILPIHHLVRSRMAEVVGRAYGVGPDDPVIAEMALEAPPRRALGDIAVPIAFAIAQELATALGTIDGVARIDAAPNGYINFFLDRAAWLRHWAAAGGGTRAEVQADAGKTIVEHTAINPNKAAHIGHLRNAALGD